MFLAPVVLVLASLPSAQPSPTIRPVETIQSGDEQALKAAGLSATGPVLLEFFRLRANQAPEPERLEALVKELTEGGEEARQRAMGQLVGHGPNAVPILRQATIQLDNREQAERARKCLQLIEGASGASLTAMASFCAWPD